MKTTLAKIKPSLTREKALSKQIKNLTQENSILKNRLEWHIKNEGFLESRISSLENEINEKVKIYGSLQKEIDLLKKDNLDRIIQVTNFRRESAIWKEALELLAKNSNQPLRQNEVKCEIKSESTTSST